MLGGGRPTLVGLSRRSGCCSLGFRLRLALLDQLGRLLVEPRLGHPGAGDDLDDPTPLAFWSALEWCVPLFEELRQLFGVTLERLGDPVEGGVDQVVGSPAGEVDASAEEVASGASPVVAVPEPGDDPLAPSKGAPASPGASAWSSLLWPLL